jgi:hypothetical protein
MVSSRTASCEGKTQEIIQRFIVLLICSDRYSD